MARVLVLDVDTGLHEAECEGINDIYKELKADPFDVVSRMIGNKYFDIYCDDIGLFRDRIVVSAVDAKTWNPMLVGNLIFANHDSSGEMTSLTDEDVSMIIKNVAKAVAKDNPAGWIVVKCSY